LISDDGFDQRAGRHGRRRQRREKTRSEAADEIRKLWPALPAASYSIRQALGQM